MKKHPADVLADRLLIDDGEAIVHASQAAAMLRTIPALEAARNALRAELAALKAQAAQPAPADPVATLHDDGYFTWKRDEFRLKFHQPLAGWRMDVYAAPQAAQPAARHVGDTKFEGWLSCHEPDRREGRTPRYSKQDMRDAYWAGHQESSAAPQAAQPLPDEWLVKVRRLVQGFEHVSGIARLWEPDYSSGSERALWARATEACADVAKMLNAHGIGKECSADR